jgi:hypothetical protein
MGENFCQLYTDEGLVTRIYKELEKLNSQKIKDPMKKWTSELNRDFSKEEHPYHERTTNQNYVKIPPRSSPNVYHQQKQQMLVRRLGKKNPYYCWWDCKLVQPLWKAVWKFLKNLKSELPFDPLIQLLGIHPKECKSAYDNDTCAPMFIAALFTAAKLFKQPRCPKTDE